MRITNEDVRKLINYTCDKCGVPELAPRIRFEWSNQLKTTMGNARVVISAQGNGGHIKLSVPVYSLASHKDQIETVIHETCHIVVSYKYIRGDYRARPKGHGREWKNAMHACGIAAERCHKVPVKKRRNRTYTVVCACMTHEVSGQVLSKMLKGTRVYHCNNCKTKVEKL